MDFIQVDPRKSMAEIQQQFEDAGWFGSNPPKLKRPFAHPEKYHSCYWCHASRQATMNLPNNFFLLTYSCGSTYDDRLSDEVIVIEGWIQGDYCKKLMDEREKERQKYWDGSGPTATPRRQSDDGYRSFL